MANVAFLPGIQHASLAMPDIHWGYGFCIGGVSATDPDEGGVISPGGVGYDINCLTADARVLHKLGYTRTIGEMASSWKAAELSCFDLESGQIRSTKVCRWFGQTPRAPVLRLTTQGGDEVCATSDHPFLTPRGMVPLGELKPGEMIAVRPFEGVRYEEPADDILVSEADVAAKWTEWQKSDNSYRQAIAFLTKRGLLPLRRSAPAVALLCKILGFVFGDGAIHLQADRKKGVTSFWANAIDLEDIRSDLLALGVKPSRIYVRSRSTAIQTQYKGYELRSTRKNGSRSLAQALQLCWPALGHRWA